MVAQPHFLLFCDTQHDPPSLADDQPGAAVDVGGRWHFVLEQLDGPQRLEAADSEVIGNRDRLALLSVVRGLEALSQPSQVTLVTTSRYVSRGLRFGLSTWRDADYTWERFGQQRPIRNSDLWRRVDTALQFHGVTCRLLQSTSLAVQPAVMPAVQPAVMPNSSPVVDRTPRPIAARTPARQSAAPQRLEQRLEQRPALRPAHDGSLVALWSRWWRGRQQTRPAFFGT